MYTLVHLQSIHTFRSPTNQPPNQDIGTQCVQKLLLFQRSRDIFFLYVPLLLPAMSAPAICAYLLVP